ncbi:hypothetical protein [Lysobacter antibioticus]|uniref:hypothetical protein n=1 Tax=Lysobacter antibioticus TaxID=84531 RepID=UPI00118760C4|nr:hypothetical protein [Lysobacter antibioticus]
MIHLEKRGGEEDLRRRLGASQGVDGAGLEVRHRRSCSRWNQAGGAKSVRRVLERPMQENVEWFYFTLGNGQSIGPLQLRRIWMEACSSTNVSVHRTHRLLLGKQTAIYSLRASPRLGDLRIVESRLRRLLDDSRLSSVLTFVSH